MASPDKTLLDTHAIGTGLKTAPHVLKSAVVYGANASGKSNLIKALQYMRDVVIASARFQTEQTFDHLHPFKLDTASATQPTEFEIAFIDDGVRYQYGFAMTGQRIVSEQLLVYKAFKPQRWFDRRFDGASGKDIHEFGTGLKGAKHLWEGATRPNALFLSVAMQLNSEALLPVFDWFLNKLVILNEHNPLSPQFSVQMLKQEAYRNSIRAFMCAADISIADIEVTTRPTKVHNIRINLGTGAREEDVSEETVDEVKIHHITEHGKAVFDLADESSGTRGLLFLAGPILDILGRGLTLAVDQLDTSLHTLLVQALVRMFHRPEANTGGAQMVFTTHDTSLLDAYGLFRRDQIWFVEKATDQSSKLFPLLDFSPRKNEALERGYLQGRYGALPFLPMTRRKRSAFWRSRRCRASSCGCCGILKKCMRRSIAMMVIRRLKVHMHGYEKGARGAFAATQGLLASASVRADALAARFDARMAPQPFTGVGGLVTLLTRLHDGC